MTSRALTFSGQCHIGREPPARFRVGPEVFRSAPNHMQPTDIHLGGCLHGRSLEQAFTCSSGWAMDTVGDTPKANDICLNPEDSSGITILLHRYAAHGVFQVKPEWTVAFRSTTIPSTILFPRSVDRAAVKIAVEPSSWKLERTDDAASDSQFTFRSFTGYAERTVRMSATPTQ